uniref:PX domain-containing protein n=1 Tax=Branchiostoma floridae TaxID=7739 RepID=C4A0D0_BRAFL|eukprot:XP_002585737.1 hypothetical protein BRAFLDRAFT_111358 [Branchiostoma floridae]
MVYLCPPVPWFTCAHLSHGLPVPTCPMVYLCPPVPWFTCAHLSHGLPVPTCPMVYLCPPVPWFTCAHLSHGLPVPTCPMVYLCPPVPWFTCAHLSHGLPVPTCPMIYLCSPVPWFTCAHLSHDLPVPTCPMVYLCPPVQVFVIEVCAAGRRHTLEKRYSELHTLHRELKKSYLTPEFPPKRVRNWNPKVLEQRRRGLETYLQGLIHQDILPKILLDFLEINMATQLGYEASHQPVLCFSADSFLHPSQKVCLCPADL